MSAGTAVIDFADVDTFGPDPVSILPDRYADLGVTIDGDTPGARDGVFVDEDFGFPGQFSGPETANTAARANTTARVTFTPEAGGAARAFRATFVDADSPGIAEAQFIARDNRRRSHPRGGGHHRRRRSAVRRPQRPGRRARHRRGAAGRRQLSIGIQI